MNLGERIAFLRTQRKITQKELALQIGVARSVLSHYEKNRNEPDVKTLLNLSDVFNVSIDYLLGKETPPKEVNKTTEEETHLLDLLRNTTPERRRIYEMMLENEQSIPKTANSNFRKTI